MLNKKAEQSVFDPQISLAKFLEIRAYNFQGEYNTNPLVPLYLTNKSEINLPMVKYSNESFSICNKMISLSPNITDRKAVNNVKVFNNGRKLIYGTSTGNLVIYDIINHNFSYANKISAHQSSIRAIQFTKNESYLLTGDNTGNIIYFALGSELVQKSKLKAHNDKESVTDISFSISDTKFITSSDDKTAKIFDLNTGLEEIIFKEHGSDIKSCDWNPYKNIVCSGGKDQLLKIWDPRSGETISTLHPHKNTINRLRFNKNGNWLLSASKDHSLKVTDIRVMKELQIFKGHEMEVNTIAWHPLIEELFCSAGVEGNLIYWFVGQGKNYVVKNAHDREIFDLCFNSTGTLLASGSNDASLRFWGRKFEYN
jgi:polyadenylation factor subunit 2